MNQPREVNVKLNLLKGFACLGVILIHVGFPGLFGQIVKNIVAYAVPIFYMIAGYYAFGKDSKTIKRRGIKIGKILLCGYALFFACSALEAILNGSFFPWLGANFTWKTPIKYAVFCTIDLAVPLWYLIAMVEMYAFWYWTVKHQKEQVALKFMPILFLLQIFLVVISEVMHLAWFWKINFLTQAMPWFLLGYFLNTSKAEKWKKLPASRYVLSVAIGLVLVVIPAVLHLSQSIGTIGYIPYAFGLFSLALKNPSQSVCRPMEYLGEKLSLNIYLLHDPLARMLALLCTHTLGGMVNHSLWAWCWPMMILVFTIFIAWGLHLIPRKKIFVHP